MQIRRDVILDEGSLKTTGVAENVLRQCGHFGYPKWRLKMYYGNGNIEHCANANDVRYVLV